MTALDGAEALGSRGRQGGAQTLPRTAGLGPTPGPECAAAAAWSEVRNDSPLRFDALILPCSLTLQSAPVSLHTHARTRIHEACTRVHAHTHTHMHTRSAFPGGNPTVEEDEKPMLTPAAGGLRHWELEVRPPRPAAGAS